MAHPVANWGTSFALIEQGVMQALATGRDSVAFDQVGIGSRRVLPSYVVRRGADSVAIGYFGNPGLARIDRSGRLLRYDGRLTTVKVSVVRIPDVPLEALAARFAATDASGGGVGQLSPRDTVRAVIGSAHVLVDYGRPSARGRMIFGGIVPWNVVWRTGANAATQFSTDAPLVIGGVEVAAGTYTLWTLPAPEGVKLIINRQHGQWGTEYDPGQDLARVDLRTSRPPAPVEQFTIALEPDDGGASLILDWATTRWSVRLRPRS